GLPCARARAAADVPCSTETAVHAGCASRVAFGNQPPSVPVPTQCISRPRGRFKSSSPRNWHTPAGICRNAPGGAVSRATLGPAFMDIDVLIAGGGPCGLMLAIELGRRGCRTLLVDAKPGTAFNPQANATQARTMEHYRRLGFAHEIRALGLPPDHPTDIAYLTRYARHELARISLPTAAEAVVRIKSLAGSWSAGTLAHRASHKVVQ